MLAPPDPENHFAPAQEHQPLGQGAGISPLAQVVTLGGSMLTLASWGAPDRQGPTNSLPPEPALAGTVNAIIYQNTVQVSESSPSPSSLFTLSWRATDLSGVGRPFISTRFIAITAVTSVQLDS
ncbi:hypothetical protein DPEC_G00162340 [Dallia pectoralis]|uniref:Uncharacterized protein n=1 Tax=Dallia pectoralis TaxID=75939 RepID=A0ACC2GH00_DALPE|nr:hypothetical protein DPEC_G00162340 [Dallia pectoralis]